MKDLNQNNNINYYIKKVCPNSKSICAFVCSTNTNTYLGIVGYFFALYKNKKTMGYILNQTEEGIYLLPIVAISLNKNDLDLENTIFISKDSIEKITIKNEEINFKKISIQLKDKNKYTMKVVKKTKANPKHEENVNTFIKLYQ